MRYTAMLLDILEIFLIFVLPILLIYYRIVPFFFRLWTLGIFFSLSIFIILRERWNWKTLGVRLDNFNGALLPYVLFTAIGLALLFLLSRWIVYKLPARWWRKPHFFLFIPVSVAQEILYRGFLFPKLAAITSSALAIIIVNAALFSFLHIIYPHKKFNLLICFIGGLGFASVYYFFPNLILVSLAHIILNITAIALGFFTLVPPETAIAKGNFGNRTARKIFLKLYND
jgi:membrane protease YdiL (CAAX protease family)